LSKSKIIYFPGIRKKEAIIDEIISLHYDAIEALDKGNHRDYEFILSRINGGVLNAEDRF